MESPSKPAAAPFHPPAPAPASPTWPRLQPADEPVRRARQRLFVDGQRPAGLVPEALLQSWERCLRAGRAPEQEPEFEPVSRGRINYVVARDHALLQAAQAPFDELQAAVARTGCKVLLTDRHGVLVRVTPAPREDGIVLSRACRVGVDLGEASVGTVAPTLSAHTGAACAVTAAEHFHDTLREIRCVAAPIRNRHGVVAGVLDLSIEGRDFGFDAQLLVQGFAMTIENRLRIAQTREHLLLRLHTSPTALDASWAGLVAVDGQGRISWLNPVAAGLLGVSPTLAPGTDAEPLLGCRFEQLLAFTVGDAPRPLLLPNGLGLWLSVRYRGLGQGQGGADDATAPAALLAHDGAPAPASGTAGVPARRRGRGTPGARS